MPETSLYLICTIFTACLSYSLNFVCHIHALYTVVTECPQTFCIWHGKILKHYG